MDGSWWYETILKSSSRINREGSLMPVPMHVLFIFTFVILWRHFSRPDIKKCCFIVVVEITLVFIIYSNKSLKLQFDFCILKSWYLQYDDQILFYCFTQMCFKVNIIVTFTGVLTLNSQVKIDYTEKSVSLTLAHILFYHRDRTWQQLISGHLQPWTASPRKLVLLGEELCVSFSLPAGQLLRLSGRLHVEAIERKPANKRSIFFFTRPGDMRLWEDDLRI